MSQSAPGPVPRSATALLSTGIRMHHYLDGPEDGRPLVLLHGWPHTGWHFRRTLPLFAAAGYRVVAPDYRGAGYSSRPRGDLDAGTRRGGYDKWSMAEDIHELVHTQLGLPAPATVLGHDIGSMVATAYAFRYRADTRALICGEAPQPGTTVFEEFKDNVLLFHFTFHSVLDLPEALVAGRERLYFQHFVSRVSHAPELIDIEHSVAAFRRPGALRAGFDLYRALPQDVADIRQAIAEGGKLTMPVLGTAGHLSPLADHTARMTAEIAADPQVTIIPESGHWIAEENPEGLVAAVVAFESATPHAQSGVDPLAAACLTSRPAAT